MSSPAGPVSGVLITGSADSLSPLATADGINLVRGSAIEQDDDTWTVIAYATQKAISDLQNSGIDVTVTILADHDILQERWDAPQEQNE
ncbi:hypothetical protein [Mycobacterium sp.]|uniref:hypothetical protein n=1 Tax=Mycobacterium sp. TaxID=1785 RepID=UPI003F9D61B5